MIHGIIITPFDAASILIVLAAILGFSIIAFSVCRHRRTGGNGGCQQRRHDHRPRYGMGLPSPRLPYHFAIAGQ